MAALLPGYCRLAASAPSDSPSLLKDYVGIENIHSQQFSVAIFIFMVLAIALFAGIVVASMAKKSAKSLKPGEKWLFAWIFFGIVVSVVFGALQLLGGYLF
ncbi:MAG TPA: hypothetical protein VJM76_00635 [Gammaproteobacteria bacterium]|nr:hypothetical protein [Gammaproteobacteria bacterium]